MSSLVRHKRPKTARVDEGCPWANLRGREYVIENLAGFVLGLEDIYADHVGHLGFHVLNAFLGVHPRPSRDGERVYYGHILDADGAMVAHIMHEDWLRLDKVRATRFIPREDK